MDKLIFNGVRCAPGESLAEALKDYARDIMALTEGLGFDPEDDVRCDIAGARAYAKERGFSLRELTPLEKMMFVRPISAPGWSVDDIEF